MKTELRIQVFCGKATYRLNVCSGNPHYGHYFRVFHKLLEISQEVAYRKVFQKRSKVAFVIKVAKKQQKHVVARFLYLVCAKIYANHTKNKISEHFCLIY